MENLALLGERRRRLELPASNPHFNLVQDSTLKDLCTVLGGDNHLDADNNNNNNNEASNGICTVLLTANGVVTKINDVGKVLWTCSLRDESEIDSGWFKIDFVDPELVCLSKRGAIVTVNPSTGESEMVGIFDQGLEDGVWSPDGETLLIVTSTEEEENEAEGETASEIDNPPLLHSRLMTMNTQFEVLAEVTIPRYVPSSTGVDADISLAWRPDGALCGVSSVDADDNARKIRIYKRESLELHAIGRAEDASGALVKNLQTVEIAWAGTGCSQVLAGVQRKGKKTHQVVFFEPNGLRHREFLLREAPATNVISLSWSAMSDLLAVGLQEADGLAKVQLWHRMNYHWYLKREFRYPGRRIEKLAFSDQSPDELCVLLQGLEWRNYHVRWDPSTVLTLDEICNAVVVDGSSLNITEFNKALIPPPMYATSHALDFTANDISFCHDDTYRGSLLIGLSTGALAFLKFDVNTSKFVNNPQLISWGELQGNDPNSFRSILVTRAESNRLYFVCIACAPCNDTSEFLLDCVVEDLESPDPKAYIQNSHLLAGRVVSITKWLDATEGCILQLQDRSLFEFEMTGSGGSLCHSYAEQLPEVCPWICAIKNSSRFAKPLHGEAERQSFVFGLSSKSRLYFHDVMLADSASSFTVSMRHEFLCYVSRGSRCQARFLPLAEFHSFDPLMGMDQGNLLEGYEPRSVEQGAKVVAVLPEQPQMILQMPRGNIEGINPRALLLRYVMNRVNSGSFGEAFRMMRKHKVDLNIIVDIDPKTFLKEGMLSFVKEIDSIDHLNLFISNLQNYDTTETRFSVPSWLRSASPKKNDRQPFDFSTKVNQVCSQAREVMMAIELSEEKPSRYYLLPILSTFAKEDPPKLDEALRLIKEHALTQPTKSSNKNPLFSEGAQNSIRYLAFLAEYELLFHTALGMYESDIARAVARNSQMDPKVYLPLLKRYNALPTFFSRFEVDMRLKRYELALRNLYQSYVVNETLESSCEETNAMIIRNSFEDCFSLIEQHELYKVGLELFRNDTEKKRRILLALGHSLIQRSQSKTALTVFLSAAPPDSDGAKLAARASKDWRIYFSMLEESNGNGDSDILSEKRRQAAREIALDIVTASGYSPESMRGSFLEAARVLVDYGDDLVGAVDYFNQAESWSEGYRVASLKNRDDLRKKVVDGAVSFAQVSLGTFADRISEFDAANRRYTDVLNLRKQNVEIEGPEPATDADDAGSLFSTASTASNMSLRSNASTSSAGSAISSVISVKTTTTFQMTGVEDNDRHRSKFNKGKKKKQRKNKKKRQKPGSEEELRELVGVMKASSPNTHFSSTISDTIRFLIFAGHCSLAEEVYLGYEKMMEAIQKSKMDRMKTHAEEKDKAIALSRTEGDQHDLSYLLLELPVEKEVDEMIICSSLDAELHSYFDLVVVET